MGLQAIDLARRSGNQLAEAQVRFSLNGIFLLLGQSYEAEPHAYVGLELAEKIRDQTLLSGALWHNQCVQYGFANWDQVRIFGNRGLAVAPNDPRILATQAAIEFETGNFEHGYVHLNKLTEMARAGPPGPTFLNTMVATVVPLAARATGSMDHLELARRVDESVVSGPFSVPFLSLWARTGLAMNAVHRHCLDLRLPRGNPAQTKWTGRQF